MALDPYGDFIAGTIPTNAGDSQYAGQPFGSVMVAPSTTMPTLTTGAVILQDTNYPSPSALAGEVSGSMMISVGSMPSFPTGYGYPGTSNGYPMGYGGYGYSYNPYASNPYGQFSGSLYMGYPGVGTAPQYGSGSTVTATGVLQLSQIMMQQIEYASMYSMGYSPYMTVPTSYSPTGSVCVTGMAFQGHAYGQSGGGGFQAQVYLYLNNTPHGDEIYFY